MKSFATSREAPWRENRNERIERPVSAALGLDGTTRQSFWGFGACANELPMAAIQQLPAARQQSLFRDMYHPQAEGLRFSVCRIPIGASDYAQSWYSLNDTEGDYDMAHFSLERDQKLLLPYLRAVKAQNPQTLFFASPWSPPAWMKHPQAYNYGKLVWAERNLRAYALYLLKFCQAYEREGIPIAQLHVQNEPISSQKFPSCCWTGEELAQFIGRYLGPVFRDAGQKTQLWLGTLNGPETDDRFLTTRFDQYANLVLHTPEAAQFISGVSYQWAGKQAVQATRDAYPRLPLMQSENECGDGRNTWEFACYIFEMVHHYLRNGVQYYVYWNPVLPAGGESTWGWRQNSLYTVENGRLKANHEYYVMRHYAQFIRPGAVLRGLAGDLCANAICAENPDGSLALVLRNPFAFPLEVSFRDSVLYLKPDTIYSYIF